MMAVVAIVLSYLIGSVPTGLWLGRWLRGVDIREHGSRNIGATNTMRVLGKGLGAVALAGDAGKGLISVALFAQMSEWSLAPVACGLAAIAGHTWSLFLKFGGGMGVATSAGVFLGLVPLPTLIALAVFVAVVMWTRMVSAGSVAAAVVLTIAVFFTSEELTLRVITLAVAMLVIFRHRENIQRILGGKENRL